MVQIEKLPVYYGKLYKYLFLSSVDGKRDDYFLVVFKDKIIARIFQKMEKWYIWYEKRNYRFPVESFTDAIHLIETEVADCTA